MSETSRGGFADGSGEGEGEPSPGEWHTGLPSQMNTQASRPAKRGAMDEPCVVTGMRSDARAENATAFEVKAADGGGSAAAQM